jgi:hypothetical protein
VNVWPRPIQQPHPPIWIPGSGSMETIRFVAERHFEMLREYAGTYAIVGSMPHDLTMRSMERFARDVMPALRAEFP